MKIIATLIPIDLVTNLFLSLFCSFVWSKNENQFSKELGGLVMKI